MPPTYRYDHMHVRSRDVKKTAEHYHRMFDARIVESIQSDGKPRTDLDLNGLTIFIAPVPAEATVPSAPRIRTKAWTTSACASRTWTRRWPSSSAGALSS
jgi:hypothetical protein